MEQQITEKKKKSIGSLAWSGLKDIGILLGVGLAFIAGILLIIAWYLMWGVICILASTVGWLPLPWLKIIKPFVPKDKYDELVRKVEEIKANANKKNDGKPTAAEPTVEGEVVESEDA